MPQLQRRFCVTDRVGVQPIGRRRSLCPQTEPYTALVCRLMVSNPVIHVITWTATHLPTPEGWKAELAWLVNPRRTLYPRNGQMSTIDQA